MVRAHVDALFQVARVGLLQSCGNADLDESALRGLRNMRFAPVSHDGVATAFTLAISVHIRSRMGRAR